jgi:hypothetical protein
MAINYVRLNMQVEFDQNGNATGNWICSGFHGTGMTSSVGPITANQIATKGETDAHLWVNIEAYYDSNATKHPLYLSSSSTFTAYVVPQLGSTKGSLQSVTLTKS